MKQIFTRRQFTLLGAAAAAYRSRSSMVTSAQESIDTWEQIMPVGPSPAARWDHTLAAGDRGKRLLLFGGRDQNGSALGDLWQFDRSTATWANIAVNGPEPRFGHAVTTDQDAGVMYLFGGQSAETFYNDLWAFDFANGNWQRLQDGASAPSARYGTSLVLTSGGRLIVSHGFTFEGRFDDTWAYELDSGKWADLTPAPETGRPLKRCLHEAAWSSRARRMLLFGGCSSGFGPCPQGDFWAFDPDAGAWSELAYPDQPLARSNPGLVYDEPRDQLLLLGGLTEAGYDGGLSILSPESGVDPSWKQPQLMSSPAPRASHDIALTGPHLYLFGGYSDAGVLSDLWTLDVRKLK